MKPFSYSHIKPIHDAISSKRQHAKRHYGVHPYFTRRPYNVVRQYILKYTQPYDRVLDPFGGSGVTAIEAFLENRIGIHNDINPLANFITRGITDLSHGNLSDYYEALREVQNRCKLRLDQITMMKEPALKQQTNGLALPDNVPLPSNSDVKMYYDLFSPRQFISLAILKNSIDEIRHTYARRAMLLAWSATLTKLNKTFLSAKGRAESRGGSSIFSIYRYKIASEPIELSPWETFEERALNVIGAKEEIDKEIETKNRTGKFTGIIEIHETNIEDLTKEVESKVDYIFTDPPYGAHISYLDLSTLWNHWLGLQVSKEVREIELIVGGQLKLSEKVYIDRLGASVRLCMKVLKRYRWMSIVFQHWNVTYFKAILSAAEESGADLKAAVSQVGDPIWSMHKKKGEESVLAGELILTFFKSGEKAKPKPEREFDVSKTVARILSDVNGDRVYGEELFNKVVIEAWHKSAIGSLDISKTEFIKLMEHNGWHYDENYHYWVRNKKLNGFLFEMK